MNYSLQLDKTVETKNIKPVDFGFQLDCVFINGTKKEYTYTNDQLDLLLIEEDGKVEAIVKQTNDINAFELLAILEQVKGSHHFALKELMDQLVWGNITRNDYLALFFSNFKDISTFFNYSHVSKRKNLKKRLLKLFW